QVRQRASQQRPQDRRDRADLALHRLGLRRHWRVLQAPASRRQVSKAKGNTRAPGASRGLFVLRAKNLKGPGHYACECQRAGGAFGGRKKRRPPYEGRRDRDGLMRDVQAAAGRRVGWTTFSLSTIVPERHARLPISPAQWRSEEHTSELQSRENLVC